MSGAKRNLIWGLAVSLLFSASIVYSLSQRVEDVRETPTAIEQPGWHYYPLALLETAGPPPPVFVLWLRPDDMLAFLKYPELRILAATYGASVELLDGTLEVVGTECVYKTSAGADLTDNARLGFIQNTRCNPLRGTPTGDLKLIVRLAERQRIGVGALVPIAPEANQGPNSIRIIGAPGGGQGMFPVLRGSYVEHLGPTFSRRVDLLAYMWQMQPANWIWELVGLACVLLFVGAAVTPHRHRSEGDKRWLFAFRAAVGTGCAAAALGVLYAVIVPPFQAPDEPAHFLEFTKVTGRSRVAEEADQWSRLNHFERLKHHSDERFRPEDALRPLPEPWKEGLPNYDVRGLITRIWSLLGHVLPHSSAPPTLLMLRVLNALALAAAVAFGTAAVVVLTDVSFPQLAVFTFLFVPAVPFFAMHVSNHALLTSAYVLFSYAVVITVFAGRHGAAGGFLLGLSAALTFALSRSAMPMAAMLVIVLLGRLLVGEEGVSTTREAMKRALTFWIGLSAGMATLPALLETRYVDYVSSLVNFQSPQMAATYRWVFAYLPWLVAFGAVVAIILDTRLFRIRRSLENKGVGATFTRAAGLLGAAVIGASMLVSLFVDYPTLRQVDVQNPPDTKGYIAEALLSALGIFRLRHLDVMTSTSFWAGFGWLDALPPDWLIVTLTTMTALALMTGLIHLSVRPNVRQLSWLATIAVGWVVTFVFYAFITLKFAPDLQGRYALGLYLSVLPICWSLLMLSGPVSRFKLPISRWTVCFAVCAMVHTYSLGFILRRYF